jgi:DNA-binding transcriptional LysR family regulator
MQNPLDSRQLIAFSTLARTGSYTQTAKELFLTHSAISHSMRALENEIGCLLLHRVGKRVMLTEAGEALLHHAERALKELEQARVSLGNLNRWGYQRLRIGADGLMARTFLPPVLMELRKAYPKLLVEIVQADAVNAPVLLKAGTADLVLGERPRQLYDLEFVTMLRDRLHIMVSAAHTWAIQGNVVREELPKEPCILSSKGTPSRSLVEEYFAAEEITLNPVVEAADYDAVIEMTKAGHGPGILPSWMVPRELTEGTLVALPLGKTHLSQSWGLLYLGSRRLRPLENQFVKLLLSQAREPQTETEPGESVASSG